MINLTRPFPSRRTTKGRVKERERERGKLCRAIISSCVDYCLAGDEVEKCTACTATATSQFVLGFVHWMKLITNQGRRILFFFFIEPSRSANESRRNSLALFLFSFSFLFFLHPSRVLRQGCRTIRVSSTFCLLSGSAAFFLECPPHLDTFLAIHKRQAPHAPAILSRFRDS